MGPLKFKGLREGLSRVPPAFPLRVLGVSSGESVKGGGGGPRALHLLCKFASPILMQCVRLKPL